MKKRAWILRFLLLAAALLAWGCDGGADGGEDAGPDGVDDGDGGDGDGARPCLNELDCVAPEECIDHVCQIQTVDPTDNLVTGRMTAVVNDSANEANTAIIHGKLGGRGFYMEWCYAEVEALGDVGLYAYNLLTTDPVDTYNFLYITVPRQSPVGQAIEIGPTKVGRATLERVTTDDNGNVTDEVPLATGKSGQIDFSQFGTATGDRIEANFSIELEPLTP